MKKTKEKLTEVNTTYARIALVLLAFNLLLTGYAVTKMVPPEMPEEQVAPQVISDDEQETIFLPVPETEA